MKEKDDFQVFQLRCMANLLAQISSSRLKKKKKILKNTEFQSLKYRLSMTAKNSAPTLEAAHL